MLFVRGEFVAEFLRSLRRPLGSFKILFKDLFIVCDRVFIPDVDHRRQLREDHLSRSHLDLA